MMNLPQKVNQLLSAMGRVVSATIQCTPSPVWLLGGLGSYWVVGFVLGSVVAPVALTVGLLAFVHAAMAGDDASAIGAHEDGPDRPPLAVRERAADRALHAVDPVFAAELGIHPDDWEEGRQVDTPSREAYVSRMVRWAHMQNGPRPRVRRA